MAHGRRRAVTLIAGSALLTAASGGVVAAMNGSAAAATAPASSESCEPLKLVSASATASATAKPSATPTPTPKPTTAAPTTAAPTTAAPTTAAPTTAAPTTAAPTTAAPTTAAPTTAAPTTAAPTTAAPTTEAPTPTDTSTTSAAADGVSGRPIVLTAFQVAAASTTPVSLCVGVLALQQNSDRGQAAQWAVGAWTVGGNLPEVELQLQSTAGTGTPGFTFGCANGEGTNLCDLGAVDASSGERLFQAALNLPLTTTVTSVSLSVTGIAAGLARDPVTSGAVRVLAPGSPTGPSLPPVATIAPTGFQPLSTTGSSGGSAANLFPVVAPGSPKAEGKTEGASPVADVSALSGGGTPAGSEIAEVAGLAALAVAMVLALTRVSFRRPAPRHAANSAAAATPPPEAPAEGHE
jgi:hypothetical protein